MEDQRMQQSNAALSLRLWWEKPAANDGCVSDREYYNYYRDYDPGTGRYITADPLGIDGLMRVRGDKFSGIDTNLYLYVGANPIGWVDSLGLYGTTSCAFYDKACDSDGGYACIAKAACPIFPPGEKNGWFQCVRQCLQDEYKNRQESDSCPIIDNPVTDHSDCFIGCEIFILSGNNK